MLGEEKRWKRKKERKKNKGKFLDWRTGEGDSDGDGEKGDVNVDEKKRRRKTRTYRTKKDDVEPTSWTPTLPRYLMIVKEIWANLYAKAGWQAYLTYLR